MHVAQTAGYILQTMGYDERTVELAKIAGYLHDIGNLVNRKDHSQSGAVMAWSIINNMSCDPGEMATIVTAIGNHDEGTGVPVNAVAAALILADKADVRRSRVRNTDPATFDIHDRVNYSVKKFALKINEDKTLVKLVFWNPRHLICSLSVHIARRNFPFILRFKASCLSPSVY